MVVAEVKVLRSPQVVPLLALMLAANAAAPARAQGVARVVEYRSPLDDSMQGYGVYLPAAPPASSDGYPVVLHGHGYGWSVSTGFSSFQKRWAEEHGWILVNLNARGPNFYEGVGDIETLNVIEDAAARFGIDRKRIYFTGGSMGGTGAVRHGLRHPDVFAAVMGVDGWTDFRLWHTHWYARTDCPELIEEFRRPLLEACSPLYWAGRGRWTASGHIVDGADTTVWPQNGIRLRNALWQLSVADPGAYDYHVIYNPELGHGAGTRMDVIYGYFLGHSLTPGRGDFLVETPRLAHGELYWGRMEAFITEGLSGGLHAEAEGPVASAFTSNLKAFTLYLRASPAGEQEEVSVYADGFLCYRGPPQAVTLDADLDGQDRVVGWRLRGEPPTGLVKTPEMAGPLGDAFEKPFLVAYATDGTPGAVSRHRLEAEQFASEWNAFMVHGQGVKARPEHELSSTDLESRTLVIFGTLESSALLRRANALCQLPVEVREGGVIVHDPIQGPRRYLGEKFGAFLCYPNPLSRFRTYLVVSHGRFFTKPDNGVPQSLGYDLEKLPWAYPDYVVFNSHQAELPHVLNVNNKPPVTCYEAGYFVEAGFLNARWQLDRRLQLRRVRLQKPELHSFVHVANLSLTRGEDGLPAAAVTIANSSGEPVPTARVTGRWWGDGELVASASTDAAGQALFPAPAGAAQERLSFEVVNVMATGATYDWPADVATTRALGWASARQLQIVQLDTPPSVSWRDPVPLSVRLLNNSPDMREVSVRLSALSGEVLSAVQRFALEAGASRPVTFTWRPGPRSAGACELLAEATAQAGGRSVSASCPVLVTIVPESELPLAIAEVKGDDLERGAPYHLSVTLRNLDSANDVEATVHCALLEARRYPAAKTVRVPAGGSTVVEWTAGPDEAPLEKGEYTVRACVADAYGVTATTSFAVR